MKRSAHVALLLMGTAAVGGTAYTLMPNENCSADRPAIAGPSGTTNCVSRSSSSSSGGSSGSGSRSFFGGGSSSSTQTASASSASSAGEASHVSRGGFGSFAHSFASHFSGGG
jgi:hypothetical protein